MGEVRKDEVVEFLHCLIQCVCNVWNTCTENEAYNTATKLGARTRITISAIMVSNSRSVSSEAHQAAPKMMTKGGIDRSLALGWLDVNQVALAGPSVKSSIEMIRIWLRSCESSSSGEEPRGADGSLLLLILFRDKKGRRDLS